MWQKLLRYIKRKLHWSGYRPVKRENHTIKCFSGSFSEKDRIYRDVVKIPKTVKDEQHLRALCECYNVNYEDYVAQRKADAELAKKGIIVAR